MNEAMNELREALNKAGNDNQALHLVWVDAQEAYVSSRIGWEEFKELSTELSERGTFKPPSMR